MKSLVSSVIRIIQSRDAAALDRFLRPRAQRGAAFEGRVRRIVDGVRAGGVREIVAVCPRPEPPVMAAALEAGVTTMFRVGGAHAIAAMAFGTRLLPRVDKIVGPGNRYVAVAKAIVAGSCAIDFYAGPTEIVVVAGTGHASWIAADLVAQ